MEAQLEEERWAWITTEEAVKISGYSRLTLYVKRKTGEITSRQVGRSILYSRTEMERLRQEREKQKGGQDG